MDNIPTFYEKEFNKNWWCYVIGYHFHIPPDDVASWDNDTIITHLTALKMMGVVK